MSRLVLVIGMFVSLSGCMPPTPLTCAPGLGPPAAIFTVFMGKAIPGRGELTDEEWQSFLDTTITTNLPNGYTVFDATGGWMNPATHQTMKEGTKVLLVALPLGPEGLDAVNRIRTNYQTRFRQQVVGMTVQNACGSF